MRSRASSAAWLAVLGGVALCLSAYQPWYSLHFSAGFLDQVDAQASHFGVLAGVIQVGVGELRSLPGGLTLSAHDVLHTIGVLLVVLGALAALLGLARAIRQEPLMTLGDGAPLALIAAIAAALTCYRLIDLPGPDGLLQVQRGPWIALAAAAAIATSAALLLSPAGRRDSGGYSDRELADAFASLTGSPPG